MEETGRSAFVAGVYLPELTEELIEKALLPIEGRDESIITINRELLAKGAIVVVWNIKKHIAEWKWIDSHRDIVRVPQEKLDIWRKWRHLPRGDRGWNSGFNGFVGNQIIDVEIAPGKSCRTLIRNLKHNAYGLPGGSIEKHEFKDGEARRKLFQTISDYEISGDHYSDYAAHREFVEETGFTALRERPGPFGKTVYTTNEKGVEIPAYDSLFERVIQFYEEDREHPGDPTYQHEDFFFWVREVLGKMNDVGVEAETLAPEIVPIMSLNRGNFYKKHAHGLMATLDMLIREYGKTEYCEALEYLQRTFPPSKKLSREPSIRIPELAGLADKDMFAYAMALDKVQPLRK